MKKIFGFLLFMVTLAASPALAESAAAASSGGGGGVQYYTIVVTLAAVTMVIATVFIGFAQSKALQTAVDGIARNPAASGKILPTLLIGLAMMESLAIYVLVIALILLFATPFLDLVG